MTKQWILVANSSIARIFVRNSRSEPLGVVETIPHPEGRLLRSELTRDRPGHERSDTSTAAARFEPHTDPKRKSQHQFAHEIATRLDEGLSTGQFEKLWLFVSSPLLGELKAALSRPVDQRVEVAQDIDFSALDVGEIEKRIQGISRPAF
ncbi:host attachment protein [Hydrogenophaga sp. ZJX-1]|uniref:host attachment protein n=1 Tax=Hydrogenophaga sp. ZJX-1 TaxID=3404778 RepID=UPI003B289652